MYVYTTYVIRGSRYTQYLCICWGSLGGLKLAKNSIQCYTFGPLNAIKFKFCKQNNVLIPTYSVLVLHTFGYLHTNLCLYMQLFTVDTVFF